MKQGENWYKPTGAVYRKVGHFYKGILGCFPALII